MFNHSDLIGTPFEYRARGSDAYDCYGLIMELYRRDYGIELPEYGSTEDPGLAQARMVAASQNWKKLECSEKGAVVLLRCGRYVRHVGYMVEDDMFYHTWEKSGGVVCEPLDVWKDKVIGFYKYEQ